jgi:hypothetical protein
MGATDRSDMMLSSVFHTVNLCLLNAHAFYLTKTGNRVPLAKFQLDIICQLLERYHTPRAAARGGRSSTSAHTHTSDLQKDTSLPWSHQRLRESAQFTHKQMSANKREKSLALCAGSVM